MKTIRYAKRVWHCSAFVAAMALLLTGCVRGDASNETDPKTPAVSQAGLPDAYEHFIYFRHDYADGGAKSDSLVLVRVTGNGFESRPVYSELNLHIDWHPLGVCNGKLYAVRMGALISVDLETGTAAEIEGEWKIGSCTWSDGKIYAFMRASSLLRVYDAETEACRDIGAEPHPPPPDVAVQTGWPPKPQVSPDHKWLAYFCRSNDFMRSYMHQLRLMAVDDGKVKTSEISVAEKEFMGGGIGTASSVPFCWLDSKTLLVVRDVSTNHFSTFWDNPEEDMMAEMILARVDIDADRITDICPLPRFRPYSGEPFFRIGPTGESPRLVIGRLGQYRIDLVERRLVKDADIGGGYSYTMGKSRDEADELRFKDKLLESEMVIQEIAASPDGRRVAWHARPLVRPSWDVDASKIRFYDTVSGETRTVAPEWIPDAWNDTRPSFEGNLLWVSTRDLTTRIQTNAPAGWKPFSPQPHPGGGQSHRDLR
jgi:hypothetical protein